MKRLIACAVLLAALAACGEKAEAPAVAAAPAENPAEQMDGPAAGRWKITTVAANKTLEPSEVCYPQMKMGEIVKQQGQAGLTCIEQTVKREDDGFLLHSICRTEQGIRIVSDSKMTGDLKKRYTLDIVTKMDPAPVPELAEQKVQVTAERVGDC